MRLKALGYLYTIPIESIGYILLFNIVFAALCGIVLLWIDFKK
jgi:hypothetical protein